MKVKNFLVDEREIIMDEIERFLCVQGISYVKVDNEIHCPNLLLRFYEFEEYLRSEMLFHQMQEGTMGYLSIEPKEYLSIEPKEYLSIEPNILFANKRLLTIEDFVKPSQPMPKIETVGENKDLSKKAYPTPRNNKKKQLQLENQRNLQRLK